MSAGLFFGIMLVLLFLSPPVSIALGVSSLLYAVVGQGVTIPAALQKIAAATDSFTLLAVPLFVLAGNLMSGGGIAKRITDFLESILGWVKGGLSIVAIAASAFFGAISGSSTATSVAIGSIMIPGMVEKKYDKDYAAAVIASSGPLGAIIPPSLIMVTYGALANVSITKLFMGGILPGIFMATTMCVVSYVICRKNGYYGNVRFDVKEVGRSFRKGLLALGMPVIVLGGIYGGIFTPTEAAAVSCIYVFIVSVFLYKEIKLSEVPKILIETAELSGAILFLYSCACLCGWVLALGQIPQAITAALLSISNNRYVIMALMMVLLLIAGCFMESIAAITILAPIIVPIVESVGIDPLHFGVVASINIAVGCLTPPFGVCLFVTSGMTGVPLENIFRRSFPLFIIMLLDIFVLAYVPIISTFLPNLLG
ncbi:MAG: TRAP transporter large permease [Lachnospiraceae bacterium]|nr:TRAP transporter large permease [Lachnospiraceae bacterium]